MKRIETTIQKELVKYIRTTYPHIDIRYNKNEGFKDIIGAVIDKKMGQAIAGTPDLTLFIHKQVYTFILELELKKKLGVLNDAQKDWWAEFRPNQNRQGQIAHGYIEAKNIIDKWVVGIGDIN